jgi:hypothetical protein
MQGFLSLRPLFEVRSNSLTYLKVFFHKILEIKKEKRFGVNALVSVSLPSAFTEAI